MPQLLVRNVPEPVVQALKERARRNGRSAEAEHRAILEANLPAKIGWDEFREVSKRLREELEGRDLGDSTEIVRHYRDTR